ncbi:glycosyltransferase family 2 protein [Microbacterium sp. NPDC064584]|uniref:glycosyltransferase family 2 protein n=1 Tax=Microbacterium sp. NPDC064584 TaxID=3155817 RepID=UPI003443B540
MLTTAVVIPTYNRPDRVVDCVRHLMRQIRIPQRIVVVDSSEGDQTRDALQEFSGVTYVRNPMGRGHTAESRAIGVSLCSEDIIAFLDDDANARPDWLVEILRRYDQRSVAGVGGSALNGYPGEREEGLGSIGCLLPDGRMTGHFAADPGRDVDVDHLLGANMSYRRAAIDQVGGIRGGYPGTCLREESDLALRVAKSGGRLVYTPDAIVDHLPGEYAKGKRFDRRYVYFANRNTVVLFSRVYGFDAPILRRYVRLALTEAVSEIRRAARALTSAFVVPPSVTARTVVGGITRSGSILAGLVAGFPAAVAGMRDDRRRSPS